ncbi:MAG TPA: Uma2 family endonuclease [Candidatus Polarisedimenticolaceae bacterium]|nr:Uma2 family endonuclease [Candidatus Polarisedimenticolaceae bacterium]
MTLEEYYAYHPDDRKYELLAGFVLSEPHPGSRHGRVIARLVRLIESHVEPRQLGFTLAGEAGYLLALDPPTVLIPDVSYLSLGRGKDHVEASTPFPGPPDLAIEVLSPSDRAAEVRGKVRTYLAAGCPLVWIVDPKRRTVTVHAGPEAATVLWEDDVLDAGPVIPEFSVEVRELFRP